MNVKESSETQVCLVSLRGCRIVPLVLPSRIPECSQFKLWLHIPPTFLTYTFLKILLGNTREGEWKEANNATSVEGYAFRFEEHHLSQDIHVILGRTPIPCSILFLGLDISPLVMLGETYPRMTALLISFRSSEAWTIQPTSHYPREFQ
jgi:hypothetical protein